MTSALTKKERMRRALWRLPVDRLPVQTNYTSVMARKLAVHFQVPLHDLPARLDNHLLRVELTYPQTVSDDGHVAYDWWGAGWDTRTEGYWHAFAPLAESQDLQACVWPDPEDPRVLDEAARVMRADGGEHFVAPNFGMCLFERAWALRGFDALLMDLLVDTPWVEELLDRIVEIHLRLARRFVTLGVDGGYFGDDYGAQRGMLFSPALWRQLFKPRLARMFAVFREAGLPVILHSDGDIREILPDLVDIGLTALNPVQPEVLEHAWLQHEFGQHLAFYGGLSTQTVLPRGAPEEVREATRACCLALAPAGTGLLLGPSHRMQSDIPVVNVDAMLEAFPDAGRAGFPA